VSALATTLGGLGAGIGEARDENQQLRQKYEGEAADRALRLKQFLLEQKVQESLAQRRQTENVVDLGTFQDPKTKEYYRLFRDLTTGQDTRTAVGTPESVVKTEEQNEAIAGRQAKAEAQRQQDRIDLENLKARHAADLKKLAAGLRPSKGAAGGVNPLVIKRWYSNLGGDPILWQIKLLETKRISYDLEPAETQQLKDLYDQSHKLMDRATELAERMAAGDKGPTTGGGGNATPPRPKNVPEGAQWDPNTRTWHM
jgi:hypothetical protein